MDMARVLALLATAAVAGLLVLLVRRRPAARMPVRALLVTLLLGGAAAYLAAEAALAELSVWDFLPLHLCDFAIFVTALALLTVRRGLAEITYFWALTGTLLAMATPDVAGAFPDWRWLAYFTM